MSKFITVETGDGLTLLNVAHIVAVSKSNEHNTLIRLTGERLIIATNEFKTVIAMLKES